MSRKPNPDSMIILGIDPGMTNMGLGVVGVRGDSIVYKGHDYLANEKGLTDPEKLRKVYVKLTRLFMSTNPDLIAVEEFFSFGRKSNANDTPRAIGVIMLWAAQRQVPVILYSPQTLKSHYGREKELVIKNVEAELGIDLPNKKVSHPFDALGIALLAAHKVTPLKG